MDGPVVTGKRMWVGDLVRLPLQFAAPRDGSSSAPAKALNNLHAFEANLPAWQSPVNLLVDTQASALGAVVQAGK